jgi:outer membrane protein OmpA-like peptidoglycan-associated protein
VVDHFIDHLRDDLIDRLVAEANPQTNWPESVVRMRIGGRVRRNIDGALAAIPGGRPELIRWFGLAIAGAVSGSIHDMEGDRGVMVTSEAHPKPWRAFGDDKLSLSPVSRDQAEQAVLAAKEDVDIAFTIGKQEAQARAEVPQSPPESVYFPFDSSTLTPEAAAGARSAARYLQYHPEAFVQLVGHTDPVGRDDYNDSLGQRRAGAVADVLAAAGVGAGRFETRSEGERSPVSTSPRMYNLDRRTDLIWEDRPTTDGSSGDAMSHDLALERAQATLAAAVGPPYTNVLRFVPHPVDASASTTGDENPPLPDWHWGALSTEVRAGIDAYINRQVGSRVTGMLAGRHELDDITESGVTVHPRVHVTAIITDLLAHPTDRLGDAFGEAPGPPAPAPAPGPAPAAP